MTINFLKYTITIYPLRNDSLVKKKKMKEKKLSGNQKLKKKKKIQSYFQAPQTIS